jgi:chromosome partitioning protein
MFPVKHPVRAAGVCGDRVVSAGRQDGRVSTESTARESLGGTSRARRRRPIWARIKGIEREPNRVVVHRTIACANQKGGVGKTTTVVNLAADLARLGQRILIIDLDSQANATSALGVDRTTVEASAYDVLSEGAAIDQVAVATPVDGLSLVPGTTGLAALEVELAGVDQRERCLDRALETSQEPYDRILLDCPPSLGLLTVNALTAADGVLIPVQCEYLALEGLTQLIATIGLIRDHLNPELAIDGAVLTMYDARTNLSADVAAEVRRHLGDKVFQTVIPRSVRLSEAPSYGLPVELYTPESKGAEAYRELAAEFLRRYPGSREPIPVMQREVVPV